jgi:hypothetical protein
VIALSDQDRRELIRWLACGVVVLFAHAGVAAALIEFGDEHCEHVQDRKHLSQ